MPATLESAGPAEKRFDEYLARLAEAAGHADRVVPLKSYCMGLLLPIERKSVEPIAARIAPGNAGKDASVAPPPCGRRALGR